jgi:hypothetical protein
MSFLQGLVSTTVSYLCLLSSWDYRYELLCLVINDHIYGFDLPKHCIFIFESYFVSLFLLIKSVHNIQ